MASTIPFGAGLRISLLALLLSPLALAAPETFLPGDKFTLDLPGGGKTPEMAVVRSGKYVFGGGKVGKDPEDLVIEISRPFAISTTEVTLGTYREFLKATQSGDLKSFSDGDDQLPVSGISWDAAEAFVSWLSHQTGYHFSLPSSTQWEYAARAGATSLYSWGDHHGDGNANCMDCGVTYDGALAPVASFKPNRWGLYDVHGNVWEWTKDCMDPNSKPPVNGMPQLFGNCNSRELRGGSARSDAWSIRFNARASSLRQSRSSDVGMRVVMEIPQK